ncbi:hypothetical protein IGI53_003125 [Enterococcus sp. DIV0788_1]
MSIKTIVLEKVDARVDEYAKEIEKLLKQEVHKRTWACHDSITTEKKGKGHYLIGVDAAVLKADDRNIGHIDYSPYYYYGHAAYTIYPKNKKALRWKGPDGQWLFAKSVRMPASPGDPFIERAVARRPKI